MKKILTLLLFQCATTIAFAQLSFEGEVVYSISVKSNVPNVTSEQLSYMIGTIQHYYMKGSNYKSTYAGTLAQWSMYIDKDKKFYEKVSTHDSIFYRDVTIDHDVITKVELKKNDTTILGYKCNKLTFTCKSGLQIYYFNSKLTVDPDLYINHQEGNWHAFLEKSKSLALKEIINKRLFTLTIIATSVKSMPIADSFFELPPGVPTAKNPAKL
jgi:hypothetical protein